MEIKFAFMALSFFAAFMAGRSTGRLISRKSNRPRQMKTHAIATELRWAFAAAGARTRCLASLVIGHIFDPLYAIHKTLKARHASGELTDERYTEKASELMGMHALMAS